MKQTFALLLDSYRDMNSRRMFWIVLVISTLVAAAFGAVGITAAGFTVFGHEFRSSFNLGFISAANFYKMIFVTVGLGIWGWLTFFAAIMALFSVSSIFPDFLASGAVDLYLSKPIGRLRLFLTKYFGGLLFLGMQIFCFCLAAFLVIGLRANLWVWGLFLAVPIVLLFYSYIFSICTFVGVWTRSTLASVLLTLVAWFVIFGVHTAETALLDLKYEDIAQANQLDDQIASEQRELARIESLPPVIPATAPATMASATRPSQSAWAWLIPHPPQNHGMSREELVRSQMEAAEAQRKEHAGQYDNWHEVFYIVMTVLPKTAETVDLLNRELFAHAGMDSFEPPRPPPRDPARASARQRHMSAEQMLEQELAKRSVTWVAGTSIGFEFVVLSLAAWMFCRRDY